MPWKPRISTIKVKCIRCRQIVEVDPYKYGRTTTCPACLEKLAAERVTSQEVTCNNCQAKFRMTTFEARRYKRFYCCDECAKEQNDSGINIYVRRSYKARQPITQEGRKRESSDSIPENDSGTN